MITTTVRFKAPAIVLGQTEQAVIESINGISRLAPRGFPSAPNEGDSEGAIAMWGQSTPPSVVVSRSPTLLTLTVRTATLPIGALVDASRWGDCVSAEIDGELLEGAMLNGAIAVDLKSTMRRAA